MPSVSRKTIITSRNSGLACFQSLLYAFQCAGLDCAGPLFIKNNTRATLKVYILLFICASSRAVHLDLTPDMKALAFIRAFKRFTARRGTTNVIINNNFKTFKSSIVKKFMLCLGWSSTEIHITRLTLVGWVLRTVSDISENVIKKDSWKINVKL